ncbi:hypothetical protein G7054_g6678 [Neopestalotiopsis clavispora]|nr:hypothetical protein G7054_g6678 [Neopestalotiopsis clavispora]
MAQTPQQRRANAKFVKDQDARRGKSDADRQARAKEVQKSPISPIWLSEFWLSLFAPTRGIGLPSKDDTLLTVCPLISVLLGFVVFGGIFFEVLQRIFWR